MLSTVEPDLHSVWFMIPQALSSSAVHGVIPLEGKRHSPSIYLASYPSFLLFIHAKPFCKGDIMILVLKMGKWVEEVNWQGQDFAEMVVEFRFVHRSAEIHHSTPNLWLPFSVTLTALTLDWSLGLEWLLMDAHPSWNISTASAAFQQVAKFEPQMLWFSVF